MFPDELLRARSALNGFQANSAYETEAELGRGRRQKKKPSRILSSDSESECNMPPAKMPCIVPNPPPVPLRLQPEKHSKVLEAMNRIRSVKSPRKRHIGNDQENIISVKKKVVACVKSPLKRLVACEKSPVKKVVACVKSPL